VQQAAAKDARVVLTGFTSGKPLQQLYSHAGVFVLPSAHEGMPIALLEALSYGLPVLASDIPANRELDLPEDSYFPVGNLDAIGTALERCGLEPHDAAANAARRDRVTADYDWDRIAAQTLQVYRRVNPGA
jgi:glycosyltransferase involved in cell wall biosynthesis